MKNQGLYKHEISRRQKLESKQRTKFACKSASIRFFNNRL